MNPQPSRTDASRQVFDRLLARLAREEVASHAADNRRAEWIRWFRLQADRVSGGYIAEFRNDWDNWPATDVPSAESVRQRVRAVRSIGRILDQVERHEDAAAEQVRRTANDWFTTLETPGTPSRSLAESLLAEDGSVSAFLALTQPVCPLADDDWDRAVDSVRKDFGPEVAIAIMRGRWREADREPIRTEPAAELSPVPPTWAASTLTPTVSLVETSEEVTPEPVPQGQPVPPVLEPTEQEAVAASNPLEGSVLDDDAPLPEERWFDRLAEELASLRTTTPDAPSVNAWTLLDRGEPSLAYHLAGSDGALDPRLAAIGAIGRAVTCPQGVLARALASLLDGLSPTSLSESEQLLIRASLMRPALLAPQSRAGLFLRALPRTTSLTRVGNLSLRTATAGERLDGSLHEYKLTHSDKLNDALEDWLARATAVVKYSAAAPLFTRTHWSLRTPDHHGNEEEIARWRNHRLTEQLSSRVIRPLLEQGADVWRFVKDDVERIEQVLEGDSLEDADRAVLAEGVLLAQSAGASQQSRTEFQGYLPAAASELAAEIRSWRNDVIAELQAFADASPDGHANVAARLGLKAVEELAELLQPNTPTSYREPDVASVLHGELLKLVDIETDSQGRPTTAPAEVVTAIQAYGQKPPISWEHAFRARAHLGDRDACQRIATITGWTGADVQRLGRVSMPPGETNPPTILQDLDEFTSLVNEAIRLQLLDEMSAAELRRRGEHVQSGHATSADVDALAEAIVQLRDRLASRRSDRGSDTFPRRVIDSAPRPPDKITPPPRPMTNPPEEPEPPSHSVFDD